MISHKNPDGQLLWKTIGGSGQAGIAFWPGSAQSGAEAGGDLMWLAEVACVVCNCRVDLYVCFHDST